MNCNNKNHSCDSCGNKCGNKHTCHSNDVVEVRHGEWKINRIYGNNLIENFRCSSCKVVNRQDSNYCPNCGAKMDGETK